MFDGRNILDAPELREIGFEIKGIGKREIESIIKQFTLSDRKEDKQQPIFGMIRIINQIRHCLAVAGGRVEERN